MNIGDLATRIHTLPPNNSRRVVHLCGLAGTGKTTAAAALVESNTLVGCVVQLDWYSKWPTMQRRARIADALASGDVDRIEAEENPINWYAWDQFRSDVETLRNTGSVSVQDAWNQTTGEKGLVLKLAVPDHGFIICEGIYLLHPSVVSLADLSILLTVPDDIARRRAEARDSHRSDPEYLAYKQYLVDKYDIPYMKRYSSSADLIVELDRV